MMENKLDIHTACRQGRSVDSLAHGCPDLPPKQWSLIKDSMAEEHVKRKLTAILSADVVEYSRLMADDDLATVRTIEMYREAVANYVVRFRGRVVDSPGDNILAEFASVVDALQCAVEIQRELAERNEALSEDRQMKFRIGINTGDVIEEGERIYGDGVNIAAQLESMANPGEICISGNVHSHVNNKLDLFYQYIGKRMVKNTNEPISVYRVLSVPGAAAHRVTKAKRLLSVKWLKMATAAVIVLLVAVAAVTIWQLYLRRPSIELAPVYKIAYPLADKPTIAVLPFKNMSTDPVQKFFADGITLNIITAFSKTLKIVTIPSNSDFANDIKTEKVQNAIEDLGVRYILQGSIQKSGDKLRITTQLVDAINKYYMWSESFDRQLEDIFTVQDEITMKIIEAVQASLKYGEI